MVTLTPYMEHQTPYISPYIYIYRSLKTGPSPMRYYILSGHEGVAEHFIWCFGIDRSETNGPRPTLDGLLKPLGVTYWWPI